jgi:hypothetical protein
MMFHASNASSNQSERFKQILPQPENHSNRNGAPCEPKTQVFLFTKGSIGRLVLSVAPSGLEKHWDQDQRKASLDRRTWIHAYSFSVNSRIRFVPRIARRQSPNFKAQHHRGRWRLVDFVSTRPDR